MAIRRRKKLLHQLTRVGLFPDEAERTDAELLGDYVARRDDAALSALVRRHGPMVWGVCRRVLRNHHDAEDAFQATFLVLVRKADSIASRELLAGWLHGVAHQTARKARANAGRRAARERPASEMPEPAVASPEPGPDLYPLLDEVLGDLPARYRAVFVLCDLEGKTRKEAARELGCPEGSVAGWLARARALLAKRLARRGVSVPGGILGPILAPGVPAALVTATIRTASSGGLVPAGVAALTKGVLTAMLLTRLKTIAVVVLGFGLLCAAAVAIGLPASNAVPTAAAQTVDIADQVEHALEMKRLQGAWLPRFLVTDDGVEPYPVQGRALLFMNSDFLRTEGRKTVQSGSFKIDPGRHQLDLVIDGGEPWDVEFTPRGLKIECAYRVVGDLLTISYTAAGKARPDNLRTGPGRTVIVYDRQKDDPGAVPPKGPVRADNDALKKFQGTWRLINYERVAGPIPADELQKLDARMVIEGDTYTMWRKDVKASQGRLSVDSDPEQAVLIRIQDAEKDVTIWCLYELRGDTLRLCQSRTGRPREFKAIEDTTITTFQRVKP